MTTEGDRFDEIVRRSQAELAAAKERDSWADCWYEDDPKQFETVVGQRLEERDALLIRRWRVDQGLTWRGVAHEAYGELRHGWRVSWSMPGHQAVGTILCNCAALYFEEDPSSEPWN